MAPDSKVHVIPKASWESILDLPNEEDQLHTRKKQYPMAAHTKEAATVVLWAINEFVAIVKLPLTTATVVIGEKFEFFGPRNNVPMTMTERKKNNCAIESGLGADNNRKREDQENNFSAPSKNRS